MTGEQLRDERHDADPPRPRGRLPQVPTPWTVLAAAVLRSDVITGNGWQSARLLAVLVLEAGEES